MYKRHYYFYYPIYYIILYYYPTTSTGKNSKPKKTYKMNEKMYVFFAFFSY